jgi:hypothetical protein
MGTSCSTACCEGPAVVFPTSHSATRNQLRKKQHRNSGGNAAPRMMRAPSLPSAAGASDIAPVATALPVPGNGASTVGGLTTRLSREGSDTLNPPVPPGHSVLLQVAAFQRGGSTHLTPHVHHHISLETKSPTRLTAATSPSTPTDFMPPPRGDIFEPFDSKISNPFEPPVRWPRTTLAPRSSWSMDNSADEMPGNPISPGAGAPCSTTARRVSPRHGAGKWFTPTSAGAAAMPLTNPTNLVAVLEPQQRTTGPRTRELSVSFTFKRVKLLSDPAGDFGDLHSAPGDVDESRMRSPHATPEDELLVPLGQPYSPDVPLDRCNTEAPLNRDAFGGDE